MAFDHFASGVLSPDHHDRLVANIDHYAKDAGIQPKWISTSLADTCGPEEVDYIRNFHFHRTGGKVQGLCYLRATPEADPETRMAAMAGALVRNFIRARVMTLGTVLDRIAKGGSVDATVLLVPNFCLSKDEGGSIATWQSHAMYDLLIQRANDGLQTVLYATSIVDLKAVCGLAPGRMIESHFLKIEI